MVMIDLDMFSTGNVHMVADVDVHVYTPYAEQVIVTTAKFDYKW